MDNLSNDFIWDTLTIWNEALEVVETVAVVLLQKPEREGAVSGLLVIVITFYSPWGPHRP